MGNGSEAENADTRQQAFKNALVGKHLPVLTLDNKWYRLLNKTGKRNGRCTESAFEETGKVKYGVEGYP